MAELQLHGILTRLEGYLDRVAEHAQSYMQSYIWSHANQGYQTGALANSIDIQRVSDESRSVGTSLRSRSGYVYGEFVDRGRGGISKEDGYLHYYDPKLGRWVKTKHVNRMEGIGFIEATRHYLEGFNVPL